MNSPAVVCKSGQLLVVNNYESLQDSTEIAVKTPCIRVGQVFGFDTYQATQPSFIFGCRYRHHRNKSGLFFDTPDEFPPVSSGTEECSPHHYTQPENQYCCCCCRDCCCCDKQNGNFQDCCSTNHRAAVKIAHPFSTLLSSQE